MLKNIIVIFLFSFSFLFYSCLGEVPIKENIDFIKNSISEREISLGNIVFGKEEENSIFLFFDFIEKNISPSLLIGMRQIELLSIKGEMVKK